MGGKNKKSRHGNSTSVQAVVASANKSRVTADQKASGEDTTKKPGSKSANVAGVNKELKSKQGPKTYSFGSSADASSSANHNKSVLKVVIDVNLEKRIISLINEHKKLNCDKGTVSGRLTSKKLQDLYVALQELSFKSEHIEEAMTNTVLYGGDLHSALDWLCLNLPDGK
ncbi:ATP-dependent RNA helicase dhx29-like [Pelobates fuscus]|uniref:ATP-dependent RNA helicase dhx29-like n=1 Tax=Pelobates fuscus TaxID=191477 RepID=UPI002FE4BAAA